MYNIRYVLYSLNAYIVHKTTILYLVSSGLSTMFLLFLENRMSIPA